MKNKPGPKSAAALATVPNVTGLPDRPAPPAHLSKAGRKVWESVTLSRPPDYFDRASLPLLTAYCFAASEHERIVRALADPEIDIDDFAKLTRLADTHAGRMGTLGTKLRLTVQATTDSRKAGRAAQHGGAFLDWEGVKRAKR